MSASSEAPQAAANVKEADLLEVGGSVEVYSDTAKGWLSAKISEKVDDSWVYVEYCFQEQPMRKCIHMKSSKLRVAGDSTSSEQAIRESWNPHTSVVISNTRPVFLATDGEVKPLMLGERQKEKPEMWAMTLGQWNKFIDYCRASSKWQEIKKCSRNECVNLHDMVKHFVIPWSLGTGCSIALLMNTDEPLEAQVMLSHSWEEDMEECQEAVNMYFKSEGIPVETPVWFCGFSQYQPEDIPEVNIEEQIKLEPFTSVIKSESVRNGGRMIAVHTTQGDLYERMWCVREVGEAMHEKVQVTAAFSHKYSKNFRCDFKNYLESGCSLDEALTLCKVPVNSLAANCSKIADKKANVAALIKLGGFEAIDKEVTDWRRKVLYDDILRVLQAVAMNKGAPNPQPLIDLAKEGCLEAVDLLHETAENGEEQVRDALCEKLQQIAKVRNMTHGWYEHCWKDRQPVCQLIITLLQTMANMQHQKSFDTLLKYPGYENLHVLAMSGVGYYRCSNDDFANRRRAGEAFDRAAEGFQEHVDETAWRCLQAELPLQTLAKQGNQFATERLMTKVKNKNEGAQRALQSLVQQWNRHALKALIDAANEEHKGEDVPSFKAWTLKVLNECKKSLRSLSTDAGSSK